MTPVSPHSHVAKSPLSAISPQAKNLGVFFYHFGAQVTSITTSVV